MKKVGEKQLILGNKNDRENWTRERTIESMKSNEFLIEGDIVQVAEDGNFYSITSERTDIHLLKEGLYAKVKPSNIIGNSTTSDRLKIPVDINLIGNIEGTTNFDGSKSVDIDVKVKNLETPREIKLTGELEGSSFFDGSKNIEIFSLVHKLHVPRNIKLTGEVDGNVNFDGSEDVIINSIVNKLHIPRNIKLTGEIEGNVDFDGSENVEINSIVNKLHTPRTIELIGDTIGNVQFDGSRNVQINTTTKDDSHNHTNSTILSVDASKINTGILSIERIPNLDASKITSGIIDIERLPAAALERLVEVENDAARFSLTKQQVQLGDVVKVNNTLKMYKVIDDNKLNLEEGYSVFVAGRAAEVPWEGVIGKPSTMPNPYGLYLSLNGISKPVYTGDNEVRINITPGSIGAQPAGNYSVVGHTHNKIQDIVDGRDITFDYSSNALDINNINWLAVWNGSKLCTIHKNNFLLSSGAVLNEGAEIRGSMASSDSWGIRGLGSDDNGYLELYTKDNGTEPIYFRQYNTSNTISHSITLMDGNGNQTFNDVSTNNITANNITARGNITGNRVFNSKWNDYAEFFERGEYTEPGDIIALDENSINEKYIKANINSRVIVGVHSDSFAHLIGGENPTNEENFFDYNIKKYIPVGLTGRVKVKVIGKINKGDNIYISNIKGVGTNKPNENNIIIGISLEDKQNENINLIKMLIK